MPGKFHFAKLTLGWFSFTSEFGLGPGGLLASDSIRSSAILVSVLWHNKSWLNTIRMTDEENISL
jgi:hypothetical protein